MSSLGNVIWFVLGGVLVALVWLIFAALFAITIIGLPIARACLEFAKLSAFPFGKAVIRDTELKGADNVSGLSKTISLVLNILWIPVGVTLALVYLAWGILACCTIVGIPAGIVCVRTAKFVLFPVGARVVTQMQAQASATANMLEKRGLVGKGAASPQNVIVNVTQASVEKISPEKEILKLSQTNNFLTLAQIISETTLEMDEAKVAVKKLVNQGMAKENVGSDGKTSYEFS